MNDNVMKALRACPLFAGMREMEIELTLDNVPHQCVSLPPHEVYALAGMPCRHVDIVVSGKLICRMAALSGKQVEVSRLRSGNLVAPAFFFSKDRCLPVSVETEGAVELFRMKPETLKALMDTDETLRMNFIRILSNIDVFLTKKMKILSLFTVREKVAYLLLERAGEQGSDEIHLERSRQEIADSFGIQKFSLLRVLSGLEEEGTIEIHGKNIRILNRRRLSL